MPEYPWVRHLSPMSMATLPPLPTPPRRILVGASDAIAVASRIATARPDLELRAIPHPQVTEADLAWAECYVGFRRPSVTTMGSVRWFTPQALASIPGSPRGRWPPPPS